MIALYRISEDYDRVTAMIEDVDSEPDAQAISELFGEVVARFEDKAAAVIGYMRNLDGEAEAYKAEALRLSGKAARLSAKADAMADYLAAEMRRCEITEINAGFSKAKFVKNPWRVDIEAGAVIPDEYLRYKPAPPPEPDKAKIKDALTAGATIEGVRLVQDERLKIS